ncbi:hypothetical protein PVAP13_7KG038790 [Panicum virgatum]|uniref:Uncharacterized protein n=1 Tax=Panicum virgatum TaxID=38727 RepID=A0A8T0Q6T5_PANVG|nr:hypothetical protein PVAP13_7KG031200 [Panicum virgatum]KAG2570705.1 hypothetical protein PVAP13_7KG038790 [Panicum virgatum]KAG2570706.1 hypothetical protein PVAP13_7KG038790 [Panicum virgatum]
MWVNPILFSVRTHLWHHQRYLPLLWRKQVLLGYVLSQSFLKFCLLGWENLPHTLLLYFTNFLASSEGCNHIVICNSQSTTRTP